MIKWTKKKANKGDHQEYESDIWEKQRQKLYVNIFFMIITQFELIEKKYSAFSQENFIWFYWNEHIIHIHWGDSHIHIYVCFIFEVLNLEKNYYFDFEVELAKFLRF